MIRKQQTVRNRWYLVVFAVIVLVLSGCNNSSSDRSPETGQTGGNETPASETVTPAVPEEEVVLKWLMLGPGKQEDAEKVWAQFNEELQHVLPNTKVEIDIVSPAEYPERFQLVLAAGEQYDLIWNGYLLNPLQELVSSGAFLPLNELVETHAPAILEELPDWVLEYGKVDGELYAITNLQRMNELRTGMRTPKSLLDQYWPHLESSKEVLLSRPTRAFNQEGYDELETYLAALKENDAIQLGINVFNLEKMNIGTVIASPFVVSLDDPDMNVVLKHELPEVKLFYDVTADWFKKGYIREDILSVQNLQADDGRIDGPIGWFQDNYEGQSVIETNRWGFPIEVVPFEEDFHISRLTAPTSTSISVNSKHPERAMQFLELMHTGKGKELYNLLVYGIEGEHYNRVSENRIETIHYSATQGTADVPYGLFRWAVGNSFNAYEVQADAEGFVEYVKRVHENAIKSPLLGFKPDTTAIRTQLAQIRAIDAEYFTGLMYGAFPDHEKAYTEMIERMNGADAKAVQEQLQRQVDEYLANK